MKGIDKALAFVKPENGKHWLTDRYFSVKTGEAMLFDLYNL